MINPSIRNEFIDVTALDVERIVRSVLRDYGLRMTLRGVSRLADAWSVSLIKRDRSAFSIIVGANSPHGIRRALMSTLEVDG